MNNNMLNLFSGRLRHTAIAIAGSLCLSLSATAADWLYLSPAGGWVQEDIQVDNYPYSLELPGHATRIWWAPEEGDRDMVRERRSEITVLEPGTEVELASSVRLPGIGPMVAGDRLTIRQFIGNQVVVSADDKAVVLGADTFSTLSFNVTPVGLDRVRLDADRPAPETRRFAWYSEELRGDVRYRLTLNEDEPADLQQYLRVVNTGTQALQAAGLSWFPGSGDTGSPRAMMMEAMADGVTETADGPVAALELRQSARLPARSETWMPVSAQPVTAEHRYELNWDTRQGELQSRSAEWRLHLSAEDSLPRLAGLIEVSWFDERLSALDSRYQRQQDRVTALSLGRNDQVTLSVEPESAASAVLLVRNHLEQPVTVNLGVTHQPDRQGSPLSDRVTITVPPGEQQFDVRFDSTSVTLQD
ncbi:MAG: hypothetical protein LAT62_00685 [Natronospirillum sp.]|uniref:hypothetical protein n=1 Tax=Natronospirillum sp. TaxID=2812955 RepID=UPI0025D7F928|nr:hypothetical protein [Natronospirillum sp.]MCH8550418.1 hypothetical protein [Natronospirillum sp.]